MLNVEPVACSQRWRETSAEKRELARLDNDLLQEVRQAAEAHRQASLGLLTVLSCCETAVAAQPQQRPPSGRPQSVLCAALLCRSRGCQADAADTQHEGSQLTWALGPRVGKALCRPVLLYKGCFRASK